MAILFLVEEAANLMAVDVHKLGIPSLAADLSMQQSQRSEKWQPGGISNGFGTMPLIM